MSMVIRTSQQVNALACCPCPVPECVPRRECESLSFSFISRGFKDAADTVFKLYRKSGFTGVHVQSVTIPFEGGPEDGLASLIVDADYEIFTGDEYDILYEGNVGLGVDCPYYLPVLSEGVCTGSGTSRQRQYFYYGFDDSHGIVSEFNRTLAMVGGTETEEHVAWSAAFGASVAAWNAAHLTGPTWQEASATHAAWEAVRDEHDAWAACEIETPGECGDEPPEEGSEPENPGIDEEPTELYAACTYRITTTYQHFPRYWGPSPGDAPDTDNDLYQDWLDGLTGGGEPPCPGTGELRVYEGFIGVSGSMNPGFTGGMPGTPYAETYGLTEPTTYAEWMAEIEALIAAETLPSEGCGGTGCAAVMVKSPEPVEGPFTLDNLSVSATKSRYRFGTPEDYGRSVWEMGWDEIEAGSQWWEWLDSGMEGPEPTPGPALVAHRSWTWAGDPEEPWSDWYDLALPEDGLKVRTGNVLTLCYRSSRLGVKPTAYGDQIALPEP